MRCATPLYSRLIGHLLLVLLIPVSTLAATGNESRSSTQLDNWTIQVSGGEPQPISIGDSWETVLGVDFDGVATYRTQLPAVANAGKRILLHFEAVATFATVKLDGHVVGEHVGGWTPFRVDVTERYQPGCILEVVVDEKPGHNTQGFLPVFIPHFGGIWGKVELLTVSDRGYLDDLSLFAAGWDNERVTFQIDVQGVTDQAAKLSVGVRRVGNDVWKWHSITKEDSSAKIEFSGNEIEGWPLWSSTNPVGVLCEIVLRDDATGAIVDQQVKNAFRRVVEARERDIYLNGEVVSVRGVLNWGYAPPRLCPSRDRDWMRQELEFIKARGFNTMKFCLWIPPREYLDLCDEMGVLAWVEYPTWHPKLTQQYRSQLLQEYEEFFQYDRNHPSVILRSLTCETGHSAEIDVIQELYDKAHAMIPNALVEDDSSWISWQRVHDFYDDHPYGNNHKWKGVLKGLDAYIQERSPKPLILGEAIAADTWTDSKLAMPEPPHALISSSHTAEAERRIEELMGKGNTWREASFVHAHETRKFQIERYRHQLLRQGYNVSVIRDFPFAAMGLIDFENNPKSTPEQWRWHAEQMICLETAEDGRSFFQGEDVPLLFHLLEPTIGEHRLEWSIDGEAQEPLLASSEDFEAKKLTVQASWRASLEELALKSHSPKRVKLDATWKKGEQVVAQNAWELWIVPPMDRSEPKKRLLAHVSFDAKRVGMRGELLELGEWSIDTKIDSGIVLARRFDEPLWSWLKAGGKVLMIPDGATGSFPVTEHWFLRGGPIVNHERIGNPGTSVMIEALQAFDLAGPVMANPDYLDEVEPFVLLWDNHDIREYRLHACSWGANVGQGRLLVSTLETDGRRGAATQSFLRFALNRLESGPFSKSLKEETLDRMFNDLKSELVEVPRSDWRFKPDPKRVGVSEQWFQQVPDEHWDTIRIAEHWDGQGYQGLDGWAWYSKELTIPKEANYMIFTGVDDYFEVFVNGVKCGTGGDLENKKTAFDMTIAIPIPMDQRGLARVAVLVDDWQGAGGIFRKVFFSSELPSSKSAILQRRTTQHSP